MLQIHPHQIPSTPNTASINGRRKGIPLRSASKDDICPGFVFRIDDGVHVLHQNVINMDQSAGGWTAINNNDTACISSAFSLNRKSEGASGPRPRSHSLSYAPSSTSILFPPNSYSFEEVENEEINNNTRRVGSSSTRRRNSVSESACITSVNHISLGYGSTSHLVPNSFLQSTSRRISTVGPSPGCTCTSCNITVTPYWRDGWAPNVMLCNACGLRYQKFALRCPSCLYIPRKEDSLTGNCIKCDIPWIYGSNN